MTQQAIISDKTFKTIKCKMTDLGYPLESWSLDGRENIILIAQKPESL